MTDEQRGDCLGYAGHPDVKTPYLDSLAADGVYFPNAWSSCPTCVPARAILHTGLSQRHTGKVGYQDRVDWNYGCTMAGELSRAGYYTQCVGKMHVHPCAIIWAFTMWSCMTAICMNTASRVWITTKISCSRTITSTGSKTSWAPRPM